MNGNNYDIINQKLPENLFEKIITTEMELSEEFDHKKLLSLFQLYSTAIQFYSLTDKSKVKIYQNRMEYYLTQKDTLKNLTKFNTEKKIGFQYIPGSYSSLHKVCGRAKEKFKLKAKEIKKEEIRKQVKILLKDVIILMKIDKKNLRDIMNSELKKQRKVWAEKLYQKRTLTNSNSTRIRTRYKMIDDESSEMEESSRVTQKENDIDFLNLLNEIDGAKSNIGDSDDDSIIGSSYEQEKSESETKEEEEKEKEENEEDDDEENIKKYVDKIEKNYNLNKSKDNIKKKYKTINKIDEKDEFAKNDNINIKYIQINIQEIRPNKNPRYFSSKCLPILVLPPLEKEEREILPTDKKEKNEANKRNEENESLKKNNNINVIIIQEPPVEPNPSGRKKSIDIENIMRSIEIDEDIKKIISEKMRKIDKIHEESNNIAAEDSNSNFQSTNSLSSVSKKINFDEMQAKFHQVIFGVENKIKKFIGDVNKHFYSEMFDKFFSKLKEMYEQKYEKYIKVNEEYFCNIKENEYMIDSDDKIEEFEKITMQNIIDCLKEEQKDQIDEIVNESNSKISKYIEEFKQSLFANNVGCQLIEERLKLDIYTMINEAFY